MLLHPAGLERRGGVNPPLYLESAGGRGRLPFAANCRTKSDRCRPLSIPLLQLAADGFALYPVHLALEGMTSAIAFSLSLPPSLCFASPSGSSCLPVTVSSNKPKVEVREDTGEAPPYLSSHFPPLLLADSL